MTVKDSQEVLMKVHEHEEESTQNTLEENEDKEYREETKVSVDASKNDDTAVQYDKVDDLDLAAEAEKLYEDEKVLEAGRILMKIDGSKRNQKHATILHKADQGNRLVSDLKSNLESDDNEWVIHGVSKGKFPTLTAHRLVEDDGGSTGVQLKARCETPIDKSLLSPLISVLNETQLYESWLPSWNVPKFKIRKVTKVLQRGRCSQVIIVTFDLPWPMAPREVVLLADAFDDIDENGDIGIVIKSLDTSDEDGSGLVPPPNKKTVRIEIDGGFLFRQCPDDHPALLEKEKRKSDEKNSLKSDQVLVTFAAIINPQMKLLPQSFLNFLVKVAFGISWGVLLKVAKDVQKGERKEHNEAIEEKRESLYDWVEERLKVMLSLIQVNALKI